MTREDWVKMWEAIKRIEYGRINRLPPRLDDIKTIKKLIQNEVGQME